MTDTCFHCHEPVPIGAQFGVQIDGVHHAVCCPGCEAVAGLILAQGGADYYTYRQGPAPRVCAQALSRREDFSAFDDAVHRPDTQTAELRVLARGVRCGACAWLIESCLGRIEGVAQVRCDVARSLVTLRWDPRALSAGDLLGELQALGYTPYPLSADTAMDLSRDERRDLLGRLAVAGLAMMQVMTYAVAGWLAGTGGMDPAIARLLGNAALVLCTAVVFYAATPFFGGALRAARAGHVNMDVPVSLAVLLGYGLSLANWLQGHGETYFESVSMFVFFLLTSRLITASLRHGQIEASLALVPMLPATALRLDGEGQLAPVPAAQLRAGDIVRVRNGDAVPADGVVVRGEGELDESLLSGEPEPQRRGGGEAVLAASINHGDAFDMRVGDDARSRVEMLAHTIEETLAGARRAPRLTDRVAAWFAPAVLMLALVTGLAWQQIDPQQTWSSVLAVLVVSCPCALALATPAAWAATLVRLARHGVLVHRPEALEALASADVACLDKTGTLTRGEPSVLRTEVNTMHPRPLDAPALLSAVAGLELHSSHPLARAFRDIEPAGVRDVRVAPGEGVSGRFGPRRLRAGSARFTGDVTPSGAGIIVTDQDGVLGRIWLADAMRADAAPMIERWRAHGIRSVILSGDEPTRVDVTALALGIDEAHANCLPEAKLAWLQRYQSAGHTVISVGDGVNDTALLAGADVSIAMGGGADLAGASADLVLTGSRLDRLAELPSIARRTLAVVHQNMGWAISYNLLAVPLAASGQIGPGLAALGMSLSSLVVVLNATRLSRGAAPGADTALPTAKVAP